MEPSKPIGFDTSLSSYQEVLFDGWCGEPVAWGFKIIHQLGEERFRELAQFGSLECIVAGSWVLVTKTITRMEAEEKYGPVTDEVYGPRGGWKSTTFGSKKFISKFLRPSK